MEVTADIQYRAAVIIPTRNRREDLRRLLRSVYAQTVSVQVLVMDDGSTDGSVELVRAEFPEAEVYTDGRSLGPTYRRNRGAERAAAPILVTLDDDCELRSPRTIADVLTYFTHPRIAGVTIPFVNILWSPEVRQPPRGGDEIYVTTSYYGGMVAFRRDVFLAVGGYRTELFMHVEEADLAIRLLNAGYVLRVGVAEPLHHYVTPTPERDGRRSLGPRNQILYAWYNVPMPWMVLHALATTVKGLRYAAGRGHLRECFAGFAQGYAEMVRQRRARRPVTAGVYRFSRSLRGHATVALHEIEAQLPPMAPLPSPASPPHLVVR